jgi:hypothetical protein
VGTVTGVFGDPTFGRVIGVEVTARDGTRRFLPRIATSLVDGVVALESPLVLVETGERDGYHRLGAVVLRDRAQLAPLRMGRDGVVERTADALASTGASAA